MEFCTSWDDEPPDTVIDVTWQRWVERPDEQTNYPPITAPTADEAKAIFLAAQPKWRRRFYEDEGSLWAVAAP